MYGEGTDPLPFLAAAYLLGVILLGGYSLWIWQQRKRLRAYLAAVDSSEQRTQEL